MDMDDEKVMDGEQTYEDHLVQVATQGMENTMKEAEVHKRQLMRQRDTAGEALERLTRLRKEATAMWEKQEQTLTMLMESATNALRVFDSSTDR